MPHHGPQRLRVLHRSTPRRAPRQPARRRAPDRSSRGRGSDLLHHHQQGPVRRRSSVAPADHHDIAGILDVPAVDAGDAAGNCRLPARSRLGPGNRVHRPAARHGVGRRPRTHLACASRALDRRQVGPDRSVPTGRVPAVGRVLPQVVARQQALRLQRSGRTGRDAAAADLFQVDGRSCRPALHLEYHAVLGMGPRVDRSRHQHRRGHPTARVPGRGRHAPDRRRGHRQALLRRHPLGTGPRRAVGRRQRPGRPVAPPGRTRDPAG